MVCADAGAACAVWRGAVQVQLRLHRAGVVPAEAVEGLGWVAVGSLTARLAASAREPGGPQGVSAAVAPCVVAAVVDTVLDVASVVPLATRTAVLEAGAQVAFVACVRSTSGGGGGGGGTTPGVDALRWPLGVEALVAGDAPAAAGVHPALLQLLVAVVAAGVARRVALLPPAVPRTPASAPSDSALVAAAQHPDVVASRLQLRCALHMALCAALGAGGVAALRSALCAAQAWAGFEQVYGGVDDVDAAGLYLVGVGVGGARQ